MSRVKCRAAFASSDPNQIAVLLHRATADVCGCETHSMSDLSPGPVRDDEFINVVISDPTNLLNGSHLNPTLLIPLDRGGVSSLRDGAADEEFEITITELKTRSSEKGIERFFHGVCRFAASTIRYQNGTRFVGIYDTALPSKPHHADIVGPDLHPITTESKTQRERDQRRRAKQLIDLIGPCFVSARSFRDGKFVTYSRPGS